MGLLAGKRLGPYEIVGPIGAGAMGEVYCARDTRLRRDVAVKVLPSAFADDPDRLRRFELEARAAGMLEHPNILTVHDIGTYDRWPYIVSELLEGETLREQLAGGAFPLRKAIDCALQIARGLACAHRKGIVHRDLKPENLFVTRDGHVKILDFGLAKLVERPPTANAVFEASTKIRETMPGVILGTVGYMSPEQVRGGEADPRSDIFTFGAILYEMVMGRRAFPGDSAVERLNAIMKDDPSGLAEPTPDLPTALVHLLRRSLEKECEDRFQSIHDLGLALEAFGAGSSSAQSPSWSGSLAAARHSRLGWVVATLSSLALAVLAVAFLRREPPDQRRLTLSVLPPEGATLVEGQAPAISPDGRLLAIVATDRSGQDLVYVRPLDAPTALPLEGSQGATLPFWSPDSRFIGFFAEGKLKRLDVSGGGPQTLCDASQNPRGGTWNRDGVILFTPAPPQPIHRVSSTGGTAAPLFPDEPIYGAFPLFLPDSRHFLYHAGIAVEPGVRQREIRVGSLDEPGTALLMRSPFTAVYSPPGYLLFRQDTALVGQRFDPERLELSGEPFPVVSHVGFDGLTYRVLATASDGGAVAYLDTGVGKTQLMWFHRDGRKLGVVTPPGDYGDISLSPDGGRAAFYKVDPESGNVDVQLVEMEGNTTSRFTFDQTVDFDPIWFPDGSHVTFASLRKGAPNLFHKLASGAGEEEQLLQRDVANFPFSWSHDGRLLVFGVNDPTTRWDVWALPANPVSGERVPFPVVVTEFDERRAQLSPDDRWLAYVSNESGRYEVYVRPFPSGSGKWQVSSGGGDQPRWRRDAKELFYVMADHRLVAVDVTAGDSFEAGPPRRLLDVRITGKDGSGRHYDVTSDGQRFLVNHLSEDGAGYATSIALHWIPTRERMR